MIEEHQQLLPCRVCGTTDGHQVIVRESQNWGMHGIEDLKWQWDNNGRCYLCGAVKARLLQFSSVDAALEAIEAEWTFDVEKEAAREYLRVQERER